MNKYTRKTLAYAWVGVVLAAVLGVVLAALTFTFGWKACGEMRRALRFEDAAVTTHEGLADPHTGYRLDETNVAPEKPDKPAPKLPSAKEIADSNLPKPKSGSQFPSAKEIADSNLPKPMSTWALETVVE
jgi:hypothetical protein